MVLACIGITILIFKLSHACSDNVRNGLNFKSGYISDHLSRFVISPREDYEDTLIKQKLWFHNEPALNWTDCEMDPYWPETAMAEISQDAETQLLAATFELHNMCLEVVEDVINDDEMLKLLHLNEVLWPAIRKSWQNGHKDFLGRFDFAWDGVNPPKMLEYNADTPSLLQESTDVQHVWFE